MFHSLAYKSSPCYRISIKKLSYYLIKNLKRFLPFLQSKINAYFQQQNHFRNANQTVPKKPQIEIKGFSLEQTRDPILRILGNPLNTIKT